MNTFRRTLFLGFICVSLLEVSYSQETSRGVDRCSPSENHGPYVVGKCGDRALPRSQTRHIRHSSIELLCGSNSRPYPRYPFPISFDLYNKWADLDYSTEVHSVDPDMVLKARQDMQKLRMDAEPPIKWSDKISYQTVETWDWVECYFGASESACGSHYETRTEYYDEPTYDSEGRQTGSKQKSRQVQVKIVHECYHDVPRHETRDCSTEIMDFDAEFYRYNPSTEWGPKVSTDYLDLLPNKYDLLPGEMENIQVFNTATGFFGGGGKTMTPKVEIGDAWNKYTPIISPSSFTCKYDTRYKMNVVIKTENRIMKAPPNAFGIPLDEYGEPIEPLAWIKVPGDKVEENGLKEELKVKPNWLLLSDRSSVYVTHLSAQTRRFNGEKGINTSANPKDVAKFWSGEGIVEAKGKKKNKGFKKETSVQIQLFEYPRGEMKIKKTPFMFRSASEAVRYQTPEGMDQYRMELAGDTSTKDLYRWTGPLGTEGLFRQFGIDLRPGRRYELKVMMNQKGIPFYDETKWSKPLEISFDLEDHKKIDQRGFVTRLVNFWGDASWKKPYTLFKDTL